MTTPFVSVCIPSYNRVDSLRRLLESVDCCEHDIEIVIREDCSPRQAQIREMVGDFSCISDYNVRYVENQKNLGFDANIRALVESASGHYIIFMGDDDIFVPNALDDFIAFLKENSNYSYVLRSYMTEHVDGETEVFRYLDESRPFPPGADTVAWLFKRSVSLSGFTISRRHALSYSTGDLDGTLLYQVYLMAQVCFDNSSIFCDIVFSHAVQSFRNDNPMFGNSSSENSRFSPGSITFDNSINFSNAYFEVSEYIDNQRNSNITDLIRLDLSKYSYPFLSIQRKRGRFPFLTYASRLAREVGLNKSFYFHIYKWALFLLGERCCDKIIIFIKRRLGKTPTL